MIPFNSLGFFFKLFASTIYPEAAKSGLAKLALSLETRSLVLDVGAGTGILTSFVRRTREDLTFFSIDPAMGMLRHSPDHNGLVCGRAEMLPFSKATFSLVMMGDALHHFPDPLQAIQEVRRVMTPSGILFVFDINPHTMLGSLICKMEALFGEPARFYSPEALEKMVAGLGFHPEVTYCGWRYVLTARLKDELYSRAHRAATRS